MMSHRSHPLILVVDDEPINLQTVGDVLDGEGYKVSFANTGYRALEVASAALPNLILLDIGLPDLNGIEVCRRLKDDHLTRDIPVLFVTSNESELERAFEAGCVDYIRKPIHEAELRGRVKVHVRINQLIDQLTYSNQRLTEANRSLSRLSVTDGLTGIANRRRFDTALELEWRRALRDREPLSCMMVDVDAFKKFNDTYGHLHGDTCLSAVAKTLAQVVNRAGDTVARYGGEEFSLLLPNTAAQGATHQAERIRAGVAALDLASSIQGFAGVTVSIGVAEMVPARDTTAGDLLLAADTALYQAKNGGRNRVVLAHA